MRLRWLSAATGLCVEHAVSVRLSTVLCRTEGTFLLFMSRYSSLL